MIRLANSLFLIIFIAWSTLAQDADIEEEFRRARIIPHALSAAPTEWLRIIYENRTLQTGELIENEEDLLHLPKIKWKSAHLRKLYTVYMFGLTEIPWRETRYEMSEGANFGLSDGCNRTRQYHCWVQVNIPGDRVRKGEQLFPYISPDCPSHEFTDRIVVLAFGQNFLVNIPTGKMHHAKLFSECSPTSRLVNKFNLTGPIAGNFFYMKCDTQNFMLEYP
ncbi:uncharacterized protein LOC135845798 [Planococcus citri]|uniref:uncharacterized protein LOC135845798 n=1 Tax=Planococcus citri TaxID=170843 RepID=UPI0031F8919A